MSHVEAIFHILKNNSSVFLWVLAFFSLCAVCFHFHRTDTHRIYGPCQGAGHSQMKHRIIFGLICLSSKCSSILKSEAVSLLLGGVKSTLVELLISVQKDMPKFSEI